jgi:hypothetical protein
VRAEVSTMLTANQKQAAAKIATDAGYLEWCEECPGYRPTNDAREPGSVERLLEFGAKEITRRDDPYPDFDGDEETTKEAILAVLNEAAMVQCRHGRPEREQPSV